MNTLGNVVTVEEALDSLQVKWTVSLDDIVTDCSSIYFNASYYPQSYEGDKYSLPFTCFLNSNSSQLEFTLSPAANSSITYTSQDALYDSLSSSHLTLSAAAEAAAKSSSTGFYGGSKGYNI
jgi:hypothetical protein